MYSIKKDGNVYRLYNNKTNKLLKPVYIKEETAKKNLDKKNCVAEVNDKFKKPKAPKAPKEPKAKKAKQFNIEKAKTYGTMKIIDAPKPKAKPKAKPNQKKFKMSKDVAGVVNQMLGDQSTTTKQLWKGLIENMKEMYSEYNYFQDLRSLIDVEQGPNNKVFPDFSELERVLKASYPDIGNVPKSVLNKIKKIILKGDAETLKIVKEVIIKLSDLMFEDDAENRYDRMDSIAYDNYDIKGFFKLYKNDNSSGFSKVGIYKKGLAKNIARMKKTVKEERAQFYKLLVDYFKKKADNIRANVIVENI